MKIGFIGTGNMGGPMARNLLKAGHEVVAFDVSAAALDKVVEAGAIRGESPQHVAAAGCALILTMLPTPELVRRVCLGEAGVFAAAAASTLIIDSSTIDPQTARDLADAAAKAGHRFLDAPVSGGTGGAEAGTLTFMVGGPADMVESARPVLAAMGKNIVHCGDVGNGQVAKLANNMLLAISMIGVAEAMSLGTKLGMDAATLAGVINTSSGRCWSSDTYNPMPGVLETAPAARGYTGGFGTDLMLKDLSLAVAAAKQAKQAVPLGAAAQQLYQLHSSQGQGGLDFSSIIQMLQGQ
ncbi:3-hydroxyisobutyrate dehydrogenase [Burkholderiaceae bacterium DAT-1]|nr:3-hydroxyisobutyrate dehydrogenase [Burkholderiaceae bacterium DAT-1]